MKNGFWRRAKDRILEIACWALLIPGLTLVVYGVDSDGRLMGYVVAGTVLMLTAVVLGVASVMRERRDREA
ncbi:MAG: hypothetical protein JW889_04625 [Verrucomicrobia bacterium]|nr:hypothetical protein [Verrucomicrobiota bacterium]